jgi:hypothetical protein
MTHPGLSPSGSAPETNVSVGGNRPVSPRHYRGDHPANDRPADQKIHQCNVPEVLALQFPGQVGRRPIQRDQRHKDEPQKHGPILSWLGRSPRSTIRTSGHQLLARLFGAGVLRWSPGNPMSSIGWWRGLGGVRAAGSDLTRRRAHVRLDTVGGPYGPTYRHSGTPLTRGEFVALLSG